MLSEESQRQHEQLTLDEKLQNNSMCEPQIFEDQSDKFQFGYHQQQVSNQIQIHIIYPFEQKFQKNHLVVPNIYSKIYNKVKQNQGNNNSPIIQYYDNKIINLLSISQAAWTLIDDNKNLKDKMTVVPNKNIVFSIVNLEIILQSIERQHLLQKLSFLVCFIYQLLWILSLSLREANISNIYFRNWKARVFELKRLSLNKNYTIDQQHLFGYIGSFKKIDQYLFDLEFDNTTYHTQQSLNRGQFQIVKGQYCQLSKVKQKFVDQKIVDFLRIKINRKIQLLIQKFIIYKIVEASEDELAKNMNLSITKINRKCRQQFEYKLKTIAAIKFNIGIYKYFHEGNFAEAGNNILNNRKYYNQYLTFNYKIQNQNQNQKHGKIDITIITRYFTVQEQDQPYQKHSSIMANLNYPNIYEMNQKQYIDKSNDNDEVIDLAPIDQVIDKIQKFNLFWVGFKNNQQFRQLKQSSSQFIAEHASLDTLYKQLSNKQFNQNQKVSIVGNINQLTNIKEECQYQKIQDIIYKKFESLVQKKYKNKATPQLQFYIFGVNNLEEKIQKQQSKTKLEQLKVKFYSSFQILAKELSKNYKSRIRNFSILGDQNRVITDYRLNMYWLLTGFQNKKKAFDDFQRLAHRYFKRIPKQRSKNQKQSYFEQILQTLQNYFTRNKNSSIIKIYQMDSFFYELLNNLLRIFCDPRYSGYLRFVVSLLYREIADKQDSNQSKKFTCFRGSHQNDQQLSLMNVGSILQNQIFLSASMKKSTAQNFGEMLLIIDVDSTNHSKKGYAFLNGKESQVLFNPLNYFIITRMSKNIIYMKYIDLCHQCKNQGYISYISQKSSDYQNLLRLYFKQKQMRAKAIFQGGVLFGMKLYQQAQQWYLKYLDYFVKMYENNQLHFNQLKDSQQKTKENIIFDNFLQNFSFKQFRSDMEKMQIIKQISRCRALRKFRIFQKLVEIKQTKGEIHEAIKYFALQIEGDIQFKPKNMQQLNINLFIITRQRIQNSERMLKLANKDPQRSLKILKTLELCELSLSHVQLNPEQQRHFNNTYKNLLMAKAICLKQLFRFKEVEALFHQIKQKSLIVMPSEWFILFNNYGQLHQQNCRYVQAMKYFKQCQLIVKGNQGPNINYQIVSHCNIGRICYQLGQYNEATIEFESALGKTNLNQKQDQQLTQQFIIKHLSHAADSSLNNFIFLARVYISLGYYQRAQNYLLMAKIFIKTKYKLQQSESMSVIEMRMGQVNKFKKQYQKAQLLLEKSYIYKTKLKLKIYDVEYQLGLLKIQMNDYLSAQEYMIESSYHFQSFWKSNNDNMNIDQAKILVGLMMVKAKDKESVDKNVQLFKEYQIKIQQIFRYFCKQEFYEHFQYIKMQLVKGKILYLNKQNQKALNLYQSIETKLYKITNNKDHRIIQQVRQKIIELKQKLDETIC